MMRRTGLRRTGPLRRTGLKPSGKPMARTATTRSAIKSKVRDTGPDAATVKQVVLRDHRRCAKCGGVIVGHRGWDWSVQHRRPRGSGGDRRPDTNGMGNLVLLHGNGTVGCHFDAESNRTVSDGLGLLVSRHATPALVPIDHAVHGLCLLTDDGEVTPCAPPAPEGVCA